MKYLIIGFATIYEQMWIGFIVKTETIGTGLLFFLSAGAERLDWYTVTISHIDYDEHVPK